VPPRPAGAFRLAWYVTGIWPLHGPLCEDDGVNAEDLRLAVYRTFAGTGRAPDTGQLAGQLQASLPEVTGGLKELASARHLVLGDQGQIVMAHPFSAVPLGFSVMGTGTLWWGGCAWDSFAVPHLLPAEGEVLVATSCPACRSPHAWNVGSHRPPDGGQVAHFLVPAPRMWDDVVHTCRHQRIFCSEDCVSAWLDATGSAPGYLLDLGYTSRDPSQASDYLRSVGLSGPFWGL
jgi:hypothetical protein